MHSVYTHTSTQLQRVYSFSPVGFVYNQLVRKMKLVRERRHQKALSLSLPPPIPAASFRHHQSLSSSSASSSSSPLSSTSSYSPSIDNLADLDKLVVLGHGNGGKVYKVRHRQTMAIYTLKVIRFGKNASVRQAACEAEILKRVDSEFIVRCHGVFGHDDPVDNREGNGGDICFVMEFMEAGSLHDLLLIHQRLPEKDIVNVARRVLEGLRYLHNMQIVHRDIKPSNLLINSRGEMKIADFGAAGMLEEERDSYMGTCAYMSPERFDRERWNADSPSVGCAGDVWSLGVVVLECHVGRYPLISPGEKPDWATLMCAICLREKAVVPESASPEFQSFVWRCLEKDWRVRGTVEELLAHPFVTKYCSGSSQLVDYGFDD